MATDIQIKPPEGFVLDNPSPPEGFVLDNPSPPSGFVLDTPSKPSIFKTALNAGKEAVMNAPIVGGSSPNQIIGMNTVLQQVERPIAGLRGVSKEGLSGFKKGFLQPEKYPAGTFAESLVNAGLHPLIAGTLGTLADTGYYFGIPEAMGRIVTAGKVKLLESTIQNINKALAVSGETRQGVVTIPQDYLNTVAKDKDIGSIVDAYYKSKNIELPKTSNLLEQPISSEPTPSKALLPKTPIPAPPEGFMIDTPQTKGITPVIGDLKGETTPQQGGVVPITPESPTGKVSGIAKSIEAKSIEQGLTDKGFSQLAEYNPAVIKEQSQMMSEIMNRDIEQAKRIATGKEALPQGLKGATALSAMEDYAMANKDGQLALDLANSPIASEISTAGQTLRLSGERTPDSATAKIKEIANERAKIAEKKLQGKTEGKVKSELNRSLKSKIAMARPNRYSWDSFLLEIRC